MINEMTKSRLLRRFAAALPGIGTDRQTKSRRGGGIDQIDLLFIPAAAHHHVNNRGQKNSYSGFNCGSAVATARGF